VQLSQVTMEDVQMSVEVSASDTAPVLPATTSCSTSHSSPQAMSTDHNYAVSSPTKLRRDVNSLTYRLRSKISALRNVRRRETRLRGKVNDLLYRLKSMQLLTTQTEELLEAYKDIPLALLTGRKGGRYDEDQKQFATTLHFYSPAAYHYARQRLKLLPCPRTIRNWLNTVDGSPGITQQSFDTIAEKTNAGDSASWTYKLCALHVDEMEIKRHVEYDRKTRRLVGFTDIGTGIQLLQHISKHNRARRCLSRRISGPRRGAYSTPRPIAVGEGACPQRTLPPLLASGLRFRPKFMTL